MSEALEYDKNLEVIPTNIPGLLVVHLPVRGDARGWFKENWQREKMIALGLPDFEPVQNNISFNVKAGATRGIHVEPWDKLVSLATGRIFGAWVDLRAGDSFGQTFHVELDPTVAVFVPRGVGNSYQALEDETAYTYLVNDHWRPDAGYLALNLADETANIPWPIPLEKAEISEKDQNNPRLAEIAPMKPKKILVTGANGQLGTALRATFPEAEFVDKDELDITDPAAYESRHWRDYSAIINAAAYTNVDGAETAEGREAAWKVNAEAVRLLARTALQHGITLVHISTDYVFDGTNPSHNEAEAFAPLSVYGQSKAAGDIAASTALRHYILRTSWVVGEGKNFVNTMRSLAEKGISPSVVNDQIGRLTFTEDLSAAIRHLLETQAPYGTYNVTNDGEAVSWADIAKEVFEQTGHDSAEVTGVSTAEYYAGKEGIAPRPLQSTLALDKIKSTGFTPRDWRDALKNYLTGGTKES